MRSDRSRGPSAWGLGERSPESSIGWLADLRSRIIAALISGPASRSIWNGSLTADQIIRAWLTQINFESLSKCIFCVRSLPLPPLRGPLGGFFLRGTGTNATHHCTKLWIIELFVQRRTFNNWRVEVQNFGKRNFVQLFLSFNGNPKV